MSSQARRRVVHLSLTVDISGNDHQCLNATVAIQCVSLVEEKALFSERNASSALIFSRKIMPLNKKNRQWIRRRGKYATEQEFKVRHRLSHRPVNLKQPDNRLTVSSREAMTFCIVQMHLIAISLRPLSSPIRQGWSEKKERERNVWEMIHHRNKSSDPLGMDAKDRLFIVTSGAVKQSEGSDV
jgi:hypothetical protein